MAEVQTTPKSKEEIAKDKFSAAFDKIPMQKKWELVFSLSAAEKKFESTEQWMNEVEALKQSYRLLKPGGIALLQNELSINNNLNDYKQLDDQIRKRLKIWLSQKIENIEQLELIENFENKINLLKETKNKEEMAALTFSIMAKSVLILEKPLNKSNNFYLNSSNLPENNENIGEKERNDRLKSELFCEQLDNVKFTSLEQWLKGSWDNIGYIFVADKKNEIFARNSRIININFEEKVTGNILDSLKLPEDSEVQSAILKNSSGELSFEIKILSKDKEVLARCLISNENKKTPLIEISELGKSIQGKPQAKYLERLKLEELALKSQNKTIDDSIHETSLDEYTEFCGGYEFSTYLQRLKDKFKGEEILVADIGGASGTAAKEVNDLPGISCFVIDPLLVHSPKKDFYLPLNRYFQKKIENTGVSDNSFHSLISFNSLYLTEVPKSFEECFRLLKPGGIAHLEYGYPVNAFKSLEKINPNIKKHIYVWIPTSPFEHKTVSFKEFENSVKAIIKANGAGNIGEMGPAELSILSHQDARRVPSKEVLLDRQLTKSARLFPVFIIIKPKAEQAKP